MSEKLNGAAQAWAEKPFQARTDAGTKDFECIIRGWYLDAINSIDWVASPVMVPANKVRSVVMHDENPYHRLLALAYCLGRHDVPEDIIVRGLNDTSSKCREIAFMLCKSADIAPETIHRWAFSRIPVFEKAALHALNEREGAIGKELIESCATSLSMMNAGLRDKILDRADITDEELSEWLDSNSFCLHHFAQQIRERRKASQAPAPGTVQFQDTFLGV